MTTYIVLTAGKGTRLWPITESMPKTLMPILGRSIVEWVTDGIAEDAEKIVVVVSDDADGERIRQALAEKEYADKIAYAVQTRQRGTADAVLAAKPFVDAHSFFVVVNGDTFADPSFFHTVANAARKGDPFLMGKRVADATPYGLLKTQAGMLTGIEEKPATPQEGAISTGCYGMPPEFWSALDQLTPSSRGELEATDALVSFAKTHPVKVIEFAGYWNDVGYFWNYLDSNAFALEHLMQNEILGEIDAGAHVRGKVFIAAGSVVKAGSVLEGPIYIGPGCTVGPSAILRPFATLQKDNHAGTGTEIKNSILMEEADAHAAYIGDSIICPRVNLGAGTRIANLKFDESPVKIEIKGALVDSQRRKLGAVIGEGSKTGANVSINCGVLIGSHCKVYPNSFVKRNLASNETFTGNGGAQENPLPTTDHE